LINTCWYLFKLGAALTVVAALTVAVYLFMRMDDEIRLHVQQTLAEHFPLLNVSVGGARWVEGRGIAVYDLVISETASTRRQNNLLVIDELMLVCDAELSQLLQGAPRIERVIVKHPQLWISREANGRWNVESLWPPPQHGECPPQIVIDDAMVTFVDQRQTSLQPLLLRDVNLTITPIAAETPSASVAEPSRRITLASAAETSALQQNIELRGTLGGPNIKRADIQARFDTRQKLLRLSARFQQLRLTSELNAWVSAYAGALVNQSALQGEVDGNVVVQHHFQAGARPEIEANFLLKEGRIDDPRLPHPLTDLSCAVHCSSHSLSIDQLRATCGLASLAMRLKRRGWNTAAPLSLALRVEHLPLDKKLYQSLPGLLQREWDKYQPAGLVDGDLQVTFDGTRWQPNLTLTGKELSFQSDKFPYRVSDGSGSIRFMAPAGEQPSRLDIDLTAHGGGQPLRIVGQVFDPRPGALGWLEITGRDVEIEQRLIAALPEKTRRVIQSLRPEGQFHVRWRLDRTRPGQLKPRTSLRLELVDCRINYEKFPYPLSGIHGLILAEDRRWTFRDLVSKGSHSVQCQGYLQPTSAGSELSLQFSGRQIPLDDDLLQAVPASVRQAWKEIRPRGHVDLTAEVYHATGFVKPSIRVVVRPRPESATIEPQFFPYLLEKIEGTVQYQNGQLWLSKMRAQHGRTTVRTNGSGQFDSDSGWRIQLEGLSADRLTARHDLTMALPAKLRKLIDQLRPTGSFSLHNGVLSFSKSPDPLAPLHTEWDLQLDAHQTDLQLGIELQNVHGTVRLIGASQGQRSYSAGELDIETATFEDVQFTDIRGPFWADDSTCRLGRWASGQQGQTPRRLTAKVYDGALYADAWVSFGSVPEYAVEASLAGADLLRIMIERFHSQQKFNGKLAANIRLRGTGRSMHTLVGEGDVKITEANIYKLPLLVGLLKVLRNSTPDSTAFNQVDTKFRLQGRHIYLDQLDFIGDAVSLLGKGYTNFDQQLNLVFHGVVGRNEFRIPFVKKFVGHASQQIMEMYVDGTLADPQVHTQAFPGINQLIQQIQTDLDTAVTGTRTRQAQRNLPLLPQLSKHQ